MVDLSSYKRYYHPASATANAWDVKTGKTAFLPAGKVTGTGYFPAIIKFDGSTAYLQRTSTWTVSAGFTICAVIKCASFLTSTRSNAYLMDFKGGVSYIQGGAVIEASDNAAPSRQSKVTVFCQNSSGTNICHITSGITIADNARHIILASYDPVGGTAHLYVDDTETINAAATGYAITTGTPVTGSGLKTIGKNGAVSGRDYPGHLSFFGVGPFINLSVAANRAKFYRADLSPIQQDESVWANSAWGAQPVVWNENGFPTSNAGSFGAFTAYGAITLAAASTWS